MSVTTLRAAISERAQNLRVAALLSVGVSYHSRRKDSWRTCSCSWCEKKREATDVIGSHVPRVCRGSYVADIRDVWREEMRVKYRKALKNLEDD